MKARDWREVEAAARLLELGDAASLEEIRRAYHRLSKRFHPDLASERADAAELGERMSRLTDAYGLLRRYAEGRRVPLKRPDPTDPEACDPEDWWRARFGRDPVWGTGER